MTNSLLQHKHSAKPPVSAERRSRSVRSLSRHALAGGVVIAVLVFGLGGWAAQTEVAGAVIANGTVVVEGGSRKVQHPQGGSVREILVRNDDRVTSGQLLLRLDDVVIRAELEVILSQLREAIGQQTRLTAESEGAPVMLLPAIVSDWAVDPELAAVLGEQERLRQTRKQALASQGSRLEEQITEKHAVIAGLEAQLKANDGQLDLVRKEADNLSGLFTKGLVGMQRLNEIKRSQAELEGQVGSVTAALASAKSNISELEMQRSQLTIDFRSDVLADLQTASQTVAELLQKKIAAEDRLAHLEIRAPIAGTVHESIVQTVGGVVGAGDTLMLVVPDETHLLLDTRVSPYDIDKLRVGQEAIVRLLSFDSRTTPDLAGKIETISPDFTRDPSTGAQYYTVRVDVPDNEQDKLPGDARFVPGMPAEAFFQTGNRTVLSYLMNPIDEQLRHTFRQ